MGLISRALLVGISSIPSSFEDWSLYGRVYALLCGLFRMRGALFEHNPSVLPSGWFLVCLVRTIQVAYFVSLWFTFTLCYSSLCHLKRSFLRERGRAMVRQL